MQLGIAIIVGDAAHNAMRRLQLVIARACGGNPALHQIPHVTVKQPFHAKALEPVERYFDSLVGSFAPFEVQLGGIGLFETDGVVFLEVAPSAQLEALRQRVLRDLSERLGVVPRDIEDERYRFHASLAYNLSEEQLARAREAVRGVDLTLRLAVDALGLFYYTGELWILYKRSRLPQS